MVLRGMDLLLDCIASGVYVLSAPSSSPAVGGGGHQSAHLQAQQDTVRGKQAGP